MEIRQEHCRPLRIVGRPHPCRRTEHHVGGDHGADENECGRGQNAAAAAGIEAQQRCRTGRDPLAQEHSGDDEPGYDEEHVDADVAPAELADAGVVEDDEEHGDGTQALDVWPECPVLGRGPSLVS